MKITGRGQPMGEPGKGTVRWLGWGRACKVPQRGDTETHSKGEGMSTSNAARIQKLNSGKQREEGNHRIPHSCSPQPPQWREAITPSIAHPQTPVRNVPKCLWARLPWMENTWSVTRERIPNANIKKIGICKLEVYEEINYLKHVIKTLI